MNFEEALTQKQDTIIQNWLVKVRGDTAIESTHGMTSQAILDSLPKLMGAIAHLLSQPKTANLDALLINGLDHGALRAKQGYDAEEIAREYGILRTVTFDALEEELLGNEPAPMLRAIRLINSAIDKAIALCMQRYTDERMQEVNLLYDELVTSNQELDWLVRTEKTHLSHLAHELKSPLSSIIGYSELFLKKREKESEIHPEYIERVLNSGRQLLSLVNETLEISLYQSGQLVIKPGPVEVCEVVTEVATALDILAQQKNLPITVDCRPINEPVITDSRRLRQVITNLISNAIRYTETGQIAISVRPVKAGMPITAACDLPEQYVDMEKNPTDWWAQQRRRQAKRLAICEASEEVRGDRIEIQVTDTGLGIDTAEQRRIFEPYFQGKAGQQTDASTGLGLALTHQMVKLLQGSIHVKSEPDVGSTFTITLPMRYEPTAITTNTQQQELKYS